MFEILTLVQTDKLSKKIGVILYGREYWEQVLDFKPMAEWGAIAEKDLELLHYADTPAEAFEQLRQHLEAHHLDSPAPSRKPRRRASRRPGVGTGAEVMEAGGRLGGLDLETRKKLVAQHIRTAIAPWPRRWPARPTRSSTRGRRRGSGRRARSCITSPTAR